MYHPPSKRKQLIQRTVTYALMVVAVVTLVTVLVFIMLGYRYNQNDGRIEQGGLVQFDSRPNGATITIDGMPFGTRTPSNTTMTSGQHFITIARNGYQTWQKSVDLVPGAVLWLNYARLIPNDPKAENVADFPAVTSTSPSPDNKLMAIKEAAATPTFQLADLTRDDIQTSQVTLPADSYTHPGKDASQSFTLGKWSDDSRSMIIKHTYGKNVEWLVVNPRDPASAKNVTKLLGIDASEIMFGGDSSDVLYAKIGTDVRKVNLGTATLSRPLVSNVAEFSIFDRSTIVYTTLLDPETKSRSVGYYSDGAGKTYTVRTFKDSGKSSLHFAIGRYFGDMYEAIAHGDTVEVLKGDLPSSSSDLADLKEVTSMKMPGGTDYLSVRTEGRFVVAQHGATFKTYDLELKKESSTTLAGKAAVKNELGWIDGYMPWSDRSGTLRLYEFDGANQHDIMPVAPGFDVTLSPNDKYIYGINKTDDKKYHLERVQLILS